MRGRAGPGALPGCSSRRRHPHAPAGGSAGRALVSPPSPHPTPTRRPFGAAAAAFPARGRRRLFAGTYGIISARSGLCAALPHAPWQREGRGGNGRAVAGEVLFPRWEQLTAPILFCGWFWAVGWLAEVRRGAFRTRSEGVEEVVSRTLPGDRTPRELWLRSQPPGGESGFLSVSLS